LMHSVDSIERRKPLFQIKDLIGLSLSKHPWWFYKARLIFY